ITHHDVLTAAVAAHHPNWSPDRVDQVPSSKFESTLTHKICRLSWFAHPPAPAALPLQLQLFPGYGPWIIRIQAVSLMFEASTIYLLWRSPEARSFFAPTPHPA